MISLMKCNEQCMWAILPFTKAQRICIKPPMSSMYCYTGFVSFCLPTKYASWRIRLRHSLRVVGLLHLWWNTRTALPTMSNCLPFLLLPFFISNVRPSLKTSFSTSKLKKLQFLPSRIPKRVNQLNLSIFARLSPNRGRSCPLTGQKVGKSDTDNQSHWGSAWTPVLHYSSPRRT